MNIGLIQHLSAIYLILLLLPGVSSAAMSAADIAALQQKPTWIDSAQETNSTGTYFLVLDEPWKNGSSRTLDILPYVWSDSLQLDNLAVTSATTYDLAAVPALKPVTPRLREPVTLGLLATAIVGLLLLNRRPKNTEM